MKSIQKHISFAIIFYKQKLQNLKLGMTIDCLFCADCLEILQTREGKNEE
ncbi:MAG TPA: hypothetical protein VNI60_02750 [Pyrinomonadaceae bacterium]|nr:hypothetical protein [Pyrinomonadaceae bacterium]